MLWVQKSEEIFEALWSAFISHPSPKSVAAKAGSGKRKRVHMVPSGGEAGGREFIQVHWEEVTGA